MEGTGPYKSISKSYLAVAHPPEPGYFAKAIDGLLEGTTNIHVEGDIIERDFRPLVVTEALRDSVIANPWRFRDVRIAHGLFYTDEEKEQRLEELRKVGLP